MNPLQQKAALRALDGISADAGNARVAPMLPDDGGLQAAVQRFLVEIGVAPPAEEAVSPTDEMPGAVSPTDEEDEAEGF